MQITFDDYRALTTVEVRCGKGNARALKWAGPRVWHAIESFGNAPFHIDQLIVIDPGLTHATIRATIVYINHGPDMIFIESKRYAAKQRWLVHHGDKSALQLRAMYHAIRSRRKYHSTTIECEIEEL